MQGKGKLFDIALCKCEYENCLCDKHRKFLSIVQAFLKDQRTVRIMFIGNVDKLSSIRLMDKQKRTHEQHVRELKNKIATTEIATVVPSKNI